MVFIFIHMTRKPSINKDFASVEELQIRIKRLEQDVKVLNKLYFINDIYHGVSITESCKKLGITRVTGHNWLNQWNEGGFDSLKRKYGSRGQSKLTPEQKEELSKIIVENEIYSSKTVLELIKERFNVEYSIRQVERILRDLKFGYGKPYTVFSKMPDDAEELLKKNFKE
jgi:transposase